MRFCWADRLGIAWAVLVLAIFGLMGAFDGSVDAAHNLRQIGLVFILPVWGFARLIDFVGGGPAKRRGQFRINVHR